MNLLTLNTHSWLETDPEAKLQQLITAIVAAEYDVICLQEVNQRIDSAIGITNDLYCPVPDDHEIHEDNFALRLVEGLEALDVEYYWSWSFTHTAYDRFEEGLAILSREPLLPKDLLVSSIKDPHDYRTRKLLMAVTSIQGKNYQVASAHFSWWERGFAEEWQQAAAALATAKDPLILMGDFNDPATHDGYRTVLASGLSLQDSYLAAVDPQGDVTIPAAIAGWESSDKPWRIDYIFTDRSLRIDRYQTVFDGQRGAPVSDHYGVSVSGESIDEESQT